MVIMRSSYVFMFSGQGSQYYQMGKQLFKADPVFKKWMLALNDLAGKLLGESLLERLYDESKTFSETFDRTLYTHPAIFMVEYSLVQVLQERGLEPDYVLGASLGEFAAAAVSGVLTVEEIMELIIGQAKLLEAGCEKGSMVAVLYDPHLYYETPVLFENSELASVNYPEHFVVSGSCSSLEKVQAFLRDRQIVYLKLPVSYGFHSSGIDPVARQYRSMLEQKTYQLPRVKYVSCLKGDLLTSISQYFFWDVAREPVQFPRAIQSLENGQPKVYLDLGPSGTLANFTRHLLNQDSPSESYAIMTPFHQELKQLNKLEALLQKRPEV